MEISIRHWCDGLGEVAVDYRFIDFILMQLYPSIRWKEIQGQLDISNGLDINSPAEMASM